jgi:hypothetical protein
VDGVSAGFEFRLATALSGVLMSGICFNHALRRPRSPEDVLNQAEGKLKTVGPERVRPRKCPVRLAIRGPSTVYTVPVDQLWFHLPKKCLTRHIR